jgi:hypothetical protein
MHNFKFGDKLIHSDMKEILTYIGNSKVLYRTREYYLGTADKCRLAYKAEIVIYE